MLVLTRLQGESIHLWLQTDEGGEELVCKIRILKADGRVSIGLEAAADVAIRRKEIDDAYKN